MKVGRYLFPNKTVRCKYLKNEKAVINRHNKNIIGFNPGVQGPPVSDTATMIVIIG